MYMFVCRYSHGNRRLFCGVGMAMHATVHSGKHIHTYIHRTYIYNKNYIHTPILYVLIRLLDTRENEVLLISRHVVDKIKPLAFRCTYV